MFVASLNPCHWRLHEAAGKDFEQVIFDALRDGPLYVGFDDTSGSYTGGDYSKELNADLKLLAAYIEQTQPIAWKKLQKQYPGHEAAAVAAEINKLRPKRGLLKLLREGFALAGVGKIEPGDVRRPPASTRRIARNTRRTDLPSCANSISARPGRMIRLIW